jgi:hypothetical protein
MRLFLAPPAGTPEDRGSPADPGGGAEGDWWEGAGKELLLLLLWAWGRPEVGGGIEGGDTEGSRRDWDGRGTGWE